MIRARNLARVFGKKEALARIDLEIARGELFALIGPDGAGKTTFFRIVAGLLAPSGGSLEREPGLTFGYVSQGFSLYEDLSVDENLILRARLYGLRGTEGKTRAANLLDRVGLTPARDRLAGQLSGGMKQKLSLVAALLTQPDLLLLDEPTTGVDPVSRREFWLILNELHHEGMTVLVSTPYMDEAEYATRLGFLDRGRLSALGTRSQILAEFARTLLEVRTVDRLAARARLSALLDVDDVSLFGTELHVRGREGIGAELLDSVRGALAGTVDPDKIRIVAPSLEDVFVLRGEERGEEAA